MKESSINMFARQLVSQMGDKAETYAAHQVSEMEGHTDPAAADAEKAKEWRRIRSAVLAMRQSDEQHGSV